MKDSLNVFSVKTIFKWIWWLYKWPAIAMGTLVFVYISLMLLILWPFETINSFDIPLRSGFIYHYDMWDGSVDGHHLRDQNNNVIIYSDVWRFMEHGRTIYGHRRDLHDKSFYFICDYGDDCLKTQNLTDAEFRKIIFERRLPLYTSSSGSSRIDFRREKERFKETAGSMDKPNWYYDEHLEKYRIR